MNNPITKSKKGYLSYSTPSPRAEAILRKHRLPVKNTLYVDKILVNPKSRNKGEGTRLLLSFLGMAKKTGQAVILQATPLGASQEAWKESEARLQAWYIHHGFEVLQGDWLYWR